MLMTQDEKLIKRIQTKKQELYRLATALFTPREKRPFLFNNGSRTVRITNLEELCENLDRCPVEDSLRLASWIEYLGDEQTAQRLRETPAGFRKIITGRYEELREFYPSPQE